MREYLYDFVGLNTKLFIWMNNFLNIGICPYILKAVSKIGSIKTFLFIYFLYSFYLLYKVGHFYRYSQDYIHNFSYRRWFLQKFNTLFDLGICSLLVVLSCKALKHISSFPRPFCALHNISFFSLKEIFNYDNCYHSFPSMHVIISVMECFYIWKYLNNIAKIISIIIIILISMSRISLALHFPSDVIYSFPIAFFLIYVNNYLILHLRVLKKLLIKFAIKVSAYQFKKS